MASANRLTPNQSTQLAGDLLCELAQHVGDGEAIAKTMRHWHNVLGSSRFGVVCMAAVRVTFRDCLVEPPIADAPPGVLAFNKENTA